MQKIVTLLITAVILYMVFQYNKDFLRPDTARTKAEQKAREKEQSDEATPDLSGNFIEKTLSNVLINVLKTEEGRLFMENLLTPMDQPIAGSSQGYKLNNDNLINSMFKINTFGEGKGGAASCGHLVTVKYKVLTLNNIPVEEKTETFPLGTKDTVPGLDAIVVGMKVGQTRHAVVANKFVNSKPGKVGTNYKLYAELHDIAPKVYVGDDVKIFDDEIAYHLPLLCGQKVTFDARVTKLSNGEVLYDSQKSGKKIQTTIGNVVYPVIVSHALHNKIAVGTRTVIAPGKLFKSYASKNSTFFPDSVLPVDEYFMLELTNFVSDTAITNMPAHQLNKQLRHKAE